MAKEQKKKVKNTILFIYNPNAGKKRQVVASRKELTLETISKLFQQYQIPADFVPTKGPGHATVLAKESGKKGYDTLLVAGGDGTVGEAINGLVGSSVKLGIIPLGTFMNIARMLSIPNDIEKAILLIKIGRTRRIDIGELSKLDGEKLKKPFYFMESSGVGMDAHIFQHFREIEEGNISSFLPLLKKLYQFRPEEFSVVTDKETVRTKANFITIANGPFSGTALKTAPNAKLNDRRLTLVFYKMSKPDLLLYFLRYALQHKTDLRKIQTLQATTVKISAPTPILVHADGIKYGTTPVSYKIIPACVEVICGFPESKEATSLLPKTQLDP